MIELKKIIKGYSKQNNIKFRKEDGYDCNKYSYICDKWIAQCFFV